MQYLITHDFYATRSQYVINNAGVYGRRVGFKDVTAQDMLFAFTTNAIGPLLVTKALHK